MARRGIALVYGGGRLGLMGVVADAVMDNGGEAYGVIPQALVDLEVAHTGLTELHLVANMHERKAMMTELTDAFVAHPRRHRHARRIVRGVDLERAGYHAKPFALLNVNGFWDGLVGFLDHVHGERLHVAGAARAIAGRGRDRRGDRPARRGDRGDRAENGLVIPRGSAMVRQTRRIRGEAYAISDRASAASC